MKNPSKGIYPGFEAQGSCLQKSKTGIRGSTKELNHPSCLVLLDV